MIELKVQNHHGQQVIDSRDVAQMVERPHNDLMKTIRTYAAYLNEGDFSLVDYFIESAYIDSKGQSRQNYLITKKGCDLVANKLNGKKGVLFTAAYVSAFEEMRKELEKPKRATLPDNITFSSAVGFMRLTRRVMLDMGCSAVDVGMMIKETCEAVNFPVPTTLVKQLPGQLDMFSRPGLEATQ